MWSIQLFPDASPARSLIFPWQESYISCWYSYASFPTATIQVVLIILNLKCSHAQRGSKRQQRFKWTWRPSYKVIGSAEVAMVTGSMLKNSHFFPRPPQFLNFTLVPLYVRTTFTGCCAFVWAIFLCFSQQSGDGTVGAALEWMFPAKRVEAETGEVDSSEQRDTPQDWSVLTQKRQQRWFVHHRRPRDSVRCFGTQFPFQHCSPGENCSNGNGGLVFPTPFVNLFMQNWNVRRKEVSSRCPVAAISSASASAVIYTEWEMYNNYWSFILKHIYIHYRAELDAVWPERVIKHVCVKAAVVLL